MLKRKAYKKMLALTVVSTLMGSATVWAAGVETGYTPSMDATTTTNAGDTEDANTMAAIAAARGGEVTAETAAKPADTPTTYVDNSGLSTSDQNVITVAKTTGKQDLEKAKTQATNTEVAQVQAQYVSAVTDEALQPYVGKTITALSVEGVNSEQEASLVSLLKNKVGDTLSIEGIKADIVALGNTGVFSEVNPVMTSIPEGVKVNYKVTLNPVIKGIAFSGNTVYTDEALLQYMEIQPNTVLNSIQIGQKVQGINAAYNRDGYILAHVSGINVDQNGILHVSIVEGIVEKITTAGNKKTRPKVITREFNQKEGQPFNKFLVRRSVEKVYNLGFFDDVNVRLLPGSDPDKVIIETDVLEHKTGTVTLGAGYSESDGLVGILELGEENFRGTGDKIKLHWEYGGSDNYKNYQISYMHPWLDDKGTSLGFSVFNREDEYTDYNAEGDDVAEYDKKSSGFNISLGRQTGEYTRDYLTLETRKDSYNWDNDDSSGYRYDKGPGQGNNWYNPYDFAGAHYVDNNFGRTNSITWQKVYDSRDNVYEPTQGKRLSSTIQWAGHGLGGDFDFYKFTGEIRTYHKVGHSQVLALRGRIGWAQGDVPYSQLYTVGGADTLRGYEDDQFRGKKMYDINVEYRFPIFKKISGVVFGDIGDAWDAPNVTWYDDKKSVEYSYGAGLRISTPIGPVRLDYGIGKDDKKFHFSFGAQF